MPTVSVIMPCYNYGRFIRHAVASVLLQTYEDLELIVVDDGSTDDTQEILATIDEPRMEVVRTLNNGVSSARNTGLDMASGEFIAFLDADDLWRPHYLALQVALMQAEPEVGVSITDFARFTTGDSPDGILGSGQYPKTYFDFMPELGQLPTRPSANGCGHVIEDDAFVSFISFQLYPFSLDTAVFRAEHVRELRMPPDLRFGEDRAYMLRAFLRTRAAYIDEPLADVRRHAANTSLDSPGAVDTVVLPDLLREPMTHAQRRALRRRIARSWCGLGYHEFLQRQPWDAARAYLRALRYPGRRLSTLARLASLPLTRWIAQRYLRRHATAGV